MLDPLALRPLTPHHNDGWYKVKFPNGIHFELAYYESAWNTWIRQSGRWAVGSNILVVELVMDSKGALLNRHIQRKPRYTKRRRRGLNYI